jgi:hypothetical protein
VGVAESNGESMTLGSTFQRETEHETTSAFKSGAACVEEKMLMFRVDNADFIADKLASELLPDQEYREACKNAEEAVRRLINSGGADSGRIEFDVDWPLLEADGSWLICCADDGDGMDRAELQRYTITLAVRGANDNQSIYGNQGMGLKISGPTRHKRGVLIRSLKNGEATMVQIGWNGHEYDLIPIGPDNETVATVGLEMFPPFIIERGSGTVVTFSGNTEGDNTFAPPGRPRGWLFKYLHQRFFKFSHDGIELFVRVPSGDEEDWPRTREEATERQGKRTPGKSFNLSRVYGTATIWDDAADKDGADRRGIVDLPGNLVDEIPSARVHWWVLPTGPGSDVSTRTASGGSIAVLYQNELHDWRTSNQANPLFARMGVLFGKSRVGFVLEPQGTVSSDFARAHVLVNGQPVFESNAWQAWSEQFRALMPDQIKQTMAEEQERLQAEDPDRARRIRERLKDVMALLRPRRFRQSPGGTTRASGPTVSGPDASTGAFMSSTAGMGRRPGTGTARGLGALLTKVDEIAGEEASEVFSILNLEPRWVTESAADGSAIVDPSGRGLHDRAAALLGEDGVTASILLLNLNFRGYQAILAAVNEWANPEGDEEKTKLIETWTQEWIEQKMVEAVNGLRQLENGSSWTPVNFDDALSPMALTAAFMADRYHTLREVKRQVGSIRTVPQSA